LAASATHNFDVDVGAPSPARLKLTPLGEVTKKKPGVVRLRTVGAACTVLTRWGLALVCEKRIVVNGECREGILIFTEKEKAE
jgi:hypothetical protein